MDFTPEQIEWLRDTQRLRLEPGDVVVVKIPRDTPDRQTVQDAMKEVIRLLFPNNKGIMLPDGVEIGVISPEPAGGGD